MNYSMSFYPINKYVWCAYGHPADVAEIDQETEFDVWLDFCYNDLPDVEKTPKPTHLVGYHFSQTGREVASFLAGHGFDPWWQ